MILFSDNMPRRFGYNKYKGRLNRYQRQSERLQVVSQNRRRRPGLSIGFWNTKTFISLEKQETVHRILNGRDFDILCLSETWFREDCKDHNFSHKGYSVLRNERSGADRKGGGLMLLIKEDIKAVGYIPQPRPGFSEYEKERVWVLITGSGPKVAVGFTYMRSTSSPNHVHHNRILYNLLKADIQELREDGFVVLMMGDFNGHLGSRSIENPHGIIGDTCAKNKNGTLLLEFLKNEN